MEVPMDMVERVARAMAKAEGWSLPNDMSLPYAAGSRVGRMMGLARAAIAAMREPTEEMVRAGEKEFIASDVACCMEPAEDCWQAMIDAALTSSEKG